MTKNKLVAALLALGGTLTTAAFFMAFLFVPPITYNDGRIGLAQKIFYFHVPVAEASFLVFFFTAFYGVRFLMTKRKEYDTKARIATEVTLLFVLLTMVTGDIWTRLEWNTWWVWEPRLTTYFIMTLLVIAYFVLRSSVEDEERRATYAAVFGILAFIDAPVSFLITRLIPSGLHPVVFKQGGLEPSMLVTFILAQVGMLMLGYAIYQVRLGEEQLKERLEALKASFEG